MLVNQLLDEVRPADDGQRPMLVLTDRHEDVLDLSVEQIHVLSPSPDLVELNVVVSLLSRRIELVRATLHILGDHFHEKTVEYVHLVPLFLSQDVVLEELEEEKHQGIVQIDRWVKSLKVLEQDIHSVSSGSSSFLRIVECVDFVVLVHLAALVAPLQSLVLILLLVGRRRVRLDLWRSFWLLLESLLVA